MLKKTLLFFSGLGILLGVVFGLLFAVSAQKPDRTLQLDRTIEAELTADTVSRSVEALSNWPDWHHWAVKAVALDGSLRPLPPVEQRAGPGRILRLTFLPKGNEKRKFELDVSLAEYIPGKKLRVILLRDSGGKISELVQDVEWTLAWEPKPNEPKKTVIQLSLSAHTRSARARFLADWAEKIFMNQILQVNLPALAELKYPLGVIPKPHYAR